MIVTEDMDTTPVAEALLETPTGATEIADVLLSAVALHHLLMTVTVVAVLPVVTTDLLNPSVTLDTALTAHLSTLDGRIWHRLPDLPLHIWVYIPRDLIVNLQH
jgi:hypothetical protein